MSVTTASETEQYFPVEHISSSQFFIYEKPEVKCSRIILFICIDIYGKVPVFKFPPPAFNPLVLWRPRDIFSFRGTLTAQLDYFESSSQGCGTGRECKKFHLWPQMHLPRLSGVRVHPVCVSLYANGCTTKATVISGFQAVLFGLFDVQVMLLTLLLLKGKLTSDLPENCPRGEIEKNAKLNIQNYICSELFAFIYVIFGLFCNTITASLAWQSLPSG